MANVDVDARLDLIQLVANVVNGDFDSPIGDENDQLLDLIEALSRFREQPVETLLNPITATILQTRCGEELRAFTSKHNVTLPG